MTDRTGEQLGNYHLIKLIGDGGFADVYLGEHQHLHRLAAVKVLRAQLTGNEEREFLEEARRLASLGHQHIVTVYDCDVVGGVPFLAMAYAENGTLKDRFPTDPFVQSRRIVPYVQQVAEALQFVHDKKLVHRDIKPENILLGPGDIVWLADFGIAVEAQLQIRQSAQGTVEYMAPEQIQRKACAASDQYALAVVVYEWFCGMHPFTGDMRFVMYQQIQVPPPPLRSKNNNVSPLLERVIMKALEKDPQKRFANISAFAHAFEQAYQQAFPAPHPVQGGTAAPTKVLQTPSPTTIIPRAAPTALIQQSPGTCIQTYKGHTGFVQAVAWSPVGFQVASGSVDQVHIWDALTGTAMFTHRDRQRLGQIWSLSWAPDGKQIVSGTMRQIVSVWVASTGNSLVLYRRHTESPPSLKFDVKWSPDGNYIVSGGVDKTVHVWDANNGNTLFTYQGHADEISALSWSPDSTWIASAGEDKTVQVWNALSGANAFTHSGHTQAVYAVAWSPDGKYIASASKDTTVQIWNAATDDRYFTFTGHERRVRAIAWSPDSTYIASVDDDKVVRVWEASTGKSLCSCEGHSGLVNALTWSADGQFLASASNDNAVRIWQAK
jgi:uncharacterized protein with WD repeat